MAEGVHAGKFFIPVLYEDNHLLVVVKPPNLPAQADRSGDDDLLRILKCYIGKKYQKRAMSISGLCIGLTGLWAALWCSRALPRPLRAFPGIFQHMHRTGAIWPCYRGIWRQSVCWRTGF